MKFINVFAALSITAVNFVPTLASPTGNSEAATPSNTQFGVGVAPILAQLYPGAITSITQLSPDAGQKVTNAIKQACDAVQDLNTSAADVPQEDAGSSIFSPITSAIGSFVSAALPNIAPAMTAMLSVARGDTSVAPGIVAIAQQTCKIVFN